MKTKLLAIAAIIVTLISNSSWAALKSGEGIIRDPVTGDYTATFWDADDEGTEGFSTATLATATKIDPTLTSFIKRMENGQIRYAYKLLNGKNSKQPIERFNLYNLPANITIVGSTTITEGGKRMDLFDSAITSPNKNWYGSATRGKGLAISWYFDSPNYDSRLGLQPNIALGGFSFTSSDLPGLGIAQLLGNTGYHAFQPVGESAFASDVAGQMTSIEEKDFVPRNAAVPMISVSVPFAPALLLDALHNHMLTWEKQQLVESTFLAQLDRYLVAAAEAFRHNQSKVAREHLATVRELLKKEHADLERADEARDDQDERKNTPRFTIDRLAARVLDFDVKYVLERTEKD